MDEYEIGLGLQLLPEVTGYFTEGDLSLRLRAELHDGRYVCTELTATPTSGGAPGVTSERLRDLRLAAMVEQIARVPRCEDTLSKTGRTVVAEADGPTAEVLEVVAAAYRYGHALGETPTREVMDLLGLPRSKAARWISMARKEGFLEETRARMPGGAVLDELRPQLDLSSLRRQRAVIAERLSRLQREVESFEQMYRATIESRPFSEWLALRIQDLQRAADDEQERLDAINQTISDRQQARRNDG